MSSTVVPSPTSSSIVAQRSSRLRGSRPVVGSSRNSTGGLGDERRREVEPAPHAARVGLRERGRRPRRGRTARAARSARRVATARRSPYSRPTIDEVLEPGQVLVDRGVLAGEPDPLAQPRRVAHHVEPRDAGRARVGLQERREDAHRGRLAGAVGAEQPEHGARRRLEVHAVERADGPERLHEAAHADRGLVAAGGSAALRDGGGHVALLVSTCGHGTSCLGHLLSANAANLPTSDDRDLRPPAEAALAPAGAPRLAGRGARATAWRSRRARSGATSSGCASSATRSTR